MPKNTRIARTDIDDVTQMFADLPPKEASDYTLREAIKQMIPAIDDLLKKGYSHSEVSQLLAQKNIVISETTLRQYLRDFTRQPAKISETAKKTSAATSGKKTSDKKTKTEAVEQTNTPLSVDVSPLPIVAVDVAVIPMVAAEVKAYKSPQKPGAENFN